MLAVWVFFLRLPKRDSRTGNADGISKVFLKNTFIDNVLGCCFATSKVCGKTRYSFYQIVVNFL